MDHKLTFSSLGCTYRSKKGDTVVLQGVCGQITSGGMLAILGPSGSGKSTLLDILAGRKTTGVIDGQVNLNSQPLDKSFISYIPQFFDFPPSLTLNEALSLVACLALPLATSSERNIRVSQVLESLGLSDVKDTLVGGWLPGGLSIRGLSGGEKKRLSIATGCLSKPKILIVDEPTTGQDSKSAFDAMLALKALASKEGSIIITSIHQPSKQIFELFTDIILLSKGRMVYSGPLLGCLTWLTSPSPLGLELGPYCPLKHGLASDWFLDIVNTSFSRPKRVYGKALLEEDVDAAARSFMDHYLSSTAADLSNSSQPPDTPEVSPAKFTTSCFILVNQIRVLAWREMLLITRNPADVAGRLLINAWVGCFLGVVFWGSGGEIVSDIRSTSSALYIEVIASQLIPFIYMSLFQSDKIYFVSDAGSDRVTPSSYFFAKSLVALPFNITNIFALIFPAYGMIGLSNQGSSLVLHTAVVTLGFLVANQVIFIASLIAANQDQAFGFAIGFTSLSLLLSDTIIRYSDMSWPWLHNFRFLSPMWWTTRGVIRAQFEDRTYSCTEGLANAWVTREIIPSFLPLESNVQNTFVQSLILNPGKNCLIFGSDLISYFDAQVPMNAIILSLLGWLLGLYLITFLALCLVRARGERR